MRVTRRHGVVAVLALLGSGVLGCAQGETEEQAAGVAAEPAAGVAAEQSAVPAAGQLNDAEIAAVVVTANSIDVQYGEIARERASDEAVKRFAETMIADHSAVNASAGELVGRLGVTPLANDVSRSLESGAEETRAMLRAKSGAEFDRAYIENEVAYHRAVVNALDDLLIPSAQNAELRETLVSVRPAFVAHLQHAESLLSSLGGS
jgi:putative membrane protein